MLIERLRCRKAICIAVTLAARALLVPLALVPLMASHDAALAVLLACFAVVSPLGAVGGCAWMSWTCDLVPRARFGEVFSRRQLWANLSGGVAGLAGAGLVDYWARFWPEWRLGGYVGVFVLAIAAAMASTWFLTRMPDVPMPSHPPAQLRALFAKPFADANFRRVMVFLASWSLAINLAMPFFTVYLVRDLGTGIMLPIVLTVVGQLANILALPWWGRLSDRLSNKAVISLCAPLLLLAILGWVLAAEPAPHALTLPLICATQVLLGIAGSGLDLACGNLALKSAPRGEATVYLGTNGLLKSLCGGVAPVAGGFLAQSLAGLSATVHLGSMTILSVLPLTVVFLIACAAGLAALTRLRPIAEDGVTALPQRAWRHIRPRSRSAKGGRVLTGRASASIIAPILRRRTSHDL